MVIKCIFFRLARLVNAKMALLVASIAFLVMLASCGTKPSGTEPTKQTSSSPNGKIAFARVDNRVGQYEIFVMKANGTEARKLATKPAQDNNPAWSPDGKRLALEAESSPGGNTGRNIDIYVMNADGSELKRITEEPTQESMPSWSPEGTRIAFSMVDISSFSSASASSSAKSIRDNSNENGIYTIRLDGTDLRQLTDNMVDEYPAFSPDGKTIALARVAKASGGIYTVNPDGSRLKRLTAPPQGSWDSEPSWSPDGTKIVFTRGGAHSEPNAFMMNADGTHIRKLATKMGTANSPAFSPDGKKIAFVGPEGSTDKLYVMNADGTNVRRLTKTPSAIWEEAPDWQPLP